MASHRFIGAPEGGLPPDATSVRWSITSALALAGWALAAGLSVCVVVLLAVAGAPAATTIATTITLATAGAVARLVITWRRRVGRRVWDVEVAM